SVDIKSSLQQIAARLSELQSQQTLKIQRACADALDEAGLDAPNKDEIGTALERALGYAKGASNFADNLDSLREHVAKVAAWLGKSWYKLLALVNLAL